MIPKKFPIACHTKHVTKNSTFVAIKGFNTDGNKYIEKAIQKGAKKIISEKVNEYLLNLCKKNKIKFELVKNARIALAKKSLETLKTDRIKTKIIGITGTKGKTSTTYILEHILKTAGFKTALIGTIANRILDNEIPSTNTTPESDFLHVFLNECNKQDIDFLIMEVSSHALSLNRTYGIKFDAIGFTNLAQEHLDFYKTMSKYFQAKFKIFKQIKKNSPIIINADNQWGKKAIEKQDNKRKIISLKKNFFPKIKSVTPPNMPGEFNLYNFAMAFLICKNLGLNENKIKEAIGNFPGIPGRMQKHLLNNGASGFVDYAHNPSSMHEVLKTLRKKTKMLIVVFGCGGDRDQTKRPLMGKLAIKYADTIIITNDNPRFENPEKIISDITSKLTVEEKNKTKIILNRKKAIKYAATISEKNSIIAILGKGHEKYNTIKGKKYYFSDFSEIKKY